MVYTFRSNNLLAATVAQAIAQKSNPRTIDTWEDSDDFFWLKVSGDDRELPQKLQIYADLIRCEQ